MAQQTPDRGENPAEQETYTKEQVEGIVQKRLANVKAKMPDDYEELKERAEKHEEARRAAESELDRARERIAELEEERDERERRDERAALVRKVMDEQKVDARYAPLLTADTEDALEEQARLIGERFAEPVPSEGGRPPEVRTADGDMRRFARELFGGQRS